MPTTFTWISLGNSRIAMDPTEGNQTAENAGSFVGQTYGSSGAPLSGKITTVTTIDNGGTAGALDMNNNLVNDQFSTTSGGTTTTFTFDATAVFNATLTYADGTTATVSAVISQDTAGNLYLAPDPAAGMDEAAYEAKPITSVTLNSVAGDTYSGMSSNRFSTGFDDGYIDGTAGGDLINGSYVEAVSSGSDKTDNSDAGLAGSSGNDDYIRAGSGNDSIYSDKGNDTTFGGDGNDLAYGGEHNDSLLGDAGNDSLYGDAGNDHLFGGTGNDLLYGGLGNDALSGGADADKLYGDAGNDSLSGDAGNDLLYGGDGNDAMSGGAGADVLDGGAGTDLADFSASGAGVNVTVNGTANSGGDAQGDVLSNIENLTGSSFADTLTGDGGNNILSGGVGDDRMDGGAGNDTVDGGSGSDSFTVNVGQGSDFLTGGEDKGGTETDTLDLDASKGGVSVNFTGSEQGSYSFEAGGAGSFLQMEVVSTTDGNDTISAEEAKGGVNAEANDGDDQLRGSQFNDTFSGGGGNDTLQGGTGNDVLSTGAGDDTVVFTSGSGSDVILDFDLGDPEKEGTTNDQFDVSELDDGNGNGVKAWDVKVSDDGNGNAVLNFPGGESVTVIGLSPDLASSPGQLSAMGIPCFASGTHILTPQGARCVEDILAGDFILTPDGREVPVLWHGKRSLNAGDLNTRPDLRPIRIRAGHFGALRDLIVSPQHALVVQAPSGPALIRARHLAEWRRGARVARGLACVTYHHLLLPAHDLLLAEGAVTESYYPGPLTVRSLLPEDRMALASAVLSARQPGAPFVTLEQAYGPRCLPLLSLNKARLWARQADFRRDTIGLDPDRSAASQMQSPSISP